MSFMPDGGNYRGTCGYRASAGFLLFQEPLDNFLIKDVVLLGAALWSLGEALTRNKGGNTRSVIRPNSQEVFMNKRTVANDKKISASSAGEASFGGELSVHRLGFGAMRITGEGIWGPPRDSAGALAVLRRAIELGVNFIDTADSYGPHVSEELIAKVLARSTEGLVIATKGGWNRPGPDQWTHDASPDHLRKAVEGSLKRLRLDRIDVYQLHAPDPVVSFDASVETLAQLRNEGKIRLVALSNVTREHIERALKIVP